MRRYVALSHTIEHGMLALKGLPAFAELPA
jgi:hypothetical protein